MKDAGRALTVADRDWLIEHLPEQAAAPAEYAFANLFLFRARHRYRLIEGQFAYLSGVTYDGARHALPLVPIDLAAAEALLADHDCLFPLGRDAPRLAETLGLSCRAEVADSDYIYDGARMTALTGAKTRRSQARAFADAHAPQFLAVSDVPAGELDQVLVGWLADVGREAGQTDVDECREAIALVGVLGLHGGLVRIASGEPVAFLLATARSDGEHVVHFAKGRRAFSAAYPWMFAQYAAVSGAARLNFEQDLGNPGFAQSKRSYAPIEHRPKYRLYRR